MRRRLAWAGWPVAAAVTVAIVTSRSGSAERPRADRYVTAVVERRGLENSIVTRGTVRFGIRAELELASSGRVTGVDVEVGDEIAPESTVLRVDGRPVVAVAGATPFWRDVGPGTSGPDVAELERILSEGGLDPGPVDGTYTAATGRAVRAWQARHGFPTDGTVQVGDTFVGTWPARAGSVAVEVGDFVTPGTVALRTTEPRPSVEVEFLPGERLRVRPGLAARVELSATGARTGGSLASVSSAVTTPASSPGLGGGTNPSGEGSGTSGGQPAERYAATVALDSELPAVEGAQVQVTIVVAVVEDALAVPVAAVVLDGAGNPVVRVLREDGSVEPRAVETGLAQSAVIEVRGALAEGERVVVAEVPQ